MKRSTSSANDLAAAAALPPPTPTEAQTAAAVDLASLDDAAQRAALDALGDDPGALAASCRALGVAKVLVHHGVLARLVTGLGKPGARDGRREAAFDAVAAIAVAAPRGAEPHLLPLLPLLLAAADDKAVPVRGAADRATRALMREGLAPHGAHRALPHLFAAMAEPSWRIKARAARSRRRAATDSETLSSPSRAGARPRHARRARAARRARDRRVAALDRAARRRVPLRHEEGGQEGGDARGHGRVRGHRQPRHRAVRAQAHRRARAARAH